ncbi:MAG: hypothetical protein AAGG50_03550 [Bacteroidota bacterium]
MPRLLVLLAVVLSFAAAQAHAQTPPPSPEDLPLDRASLIEALQSAGYILVMRHERTEVPSRRDDYTQAPDDCRAQRNLSVAGAAGAQETGVILRVLGIEAGRVLTSPMCRSAETARYVFGVGYEIDMRLMHGDPDGERDGDAAIQETKDLLAELAPGLPETNIALVSHGGVIFGATGIRLSEGEIGVVRLDEDGSVTIVGQFHGSDFGPYARIALRESE